METLIKKLKDIKEMLEKAYQPAKPKISMPTNGVATPSAPGAIKPSATQKVAADPNSKKNALKVAEQLENSEVAKPIAQAMTNGKPKAPSLSIKETIPTAVQKPKKLKLPTIQKSDEEDMEKGIKSAIAGAALAGSTLISPMKANASPMNTPTSQKNSVLDYGNGEKGTLNTRTYGPYEVTTMLNPVANTDGKSVNQSTELTHQVNFVGDKHSPAHARMLATELKGSGIEHSHILGLKAGQDLMSNKGKSYSGPGSKAPPMWGDK